MKILHALPTLSKGGAERVAVDLANAAIASGHQVSFVLAYPVDPALLQNRLDPRADVRFVRATRSRHGAYPSLARWLLSNRRWIMSHDIVHCHLTFGSVLGSLAYRLRGGRRGKKPAIVETYHAVGMAIAPWRRRLAMALMRRRDAIALIADDPFWSHFRKKNPGRLIRVIPNGVSAPGKPPPAKAVAHRREIGIADDIRVVGSVGRLLHERRPDALLDAFARAVPGLPQNVHLLLGGEGPERPVLAARAEALGLAGRVHLPGLVREPAEVFAVLELYLTVNVGPTTGVAGIEAALSGVPIVAFQMLPDYPSSDDDWIWSTRDVSTLADRITAFVGDPASARGLAARQQAHAQTHHSLASMARAYAGLYQEALAPQQKATDANL